VKHKTLSDYCHGKNNNIDLLRLIAAILVLFSHSYYLSSGSNDNEPLAKLSHRFTDFGSLSVTCFFIISGFLITSSYLRHNDLLTYLWGRVLRIFPALFIAAAFSAIIIGALCTSLPKGAYLTHPSVYAFIKNNTLLRVTYLLPSVFTHNPYPNIVNGSLWTLPIEFMLYIIIGIIGYMTLLRRKTIGTLSVIGALLATLAILHFKKSLFMTYIPIDALTPWECFFIGSLFYLCRDKIILNYKIAIILILSCFCFTNPHLFKLIFYITFAYCIFLFSYRAPLKGYHLTKHGDISYGIYIYAFCVQQMLEYFFHFTSPWALCFSSLPITVALAIMSWFIIEKPALRLKKSLPHILHFLKTP